MAMKILKDIFREQLLFQEDKPVGDAIFTPNEHRKRIANKVLQQLGAVDIKGVWAEACVLHPGLRSFKTFVQLEAEREQLLKGCNSICRLIDSITSAPTSGDAAQSQSKFSRIEYDPNTLGTASIDEWNYMNH